MKGTWVLEYAHRGQLPSEIIGIIISFSLSHKNAGTLVGTFQL